MSTEKQLNKVRIKPSGVAACVPTPNINPEKRRKSSIRKWLGKALARFNSGQLYKDLMRARSRPDLWARKVGHRDGVRAECALIVAIVDNLNATNWHSRLNLELLAEQAGLTTTGKSGMKSISRASRAAERLDMMGIIKAPKAGFMPHLKTCEIRHIEITPKFLELIGVKLKDAIRERARLVGVAKEEAHTVTMNHPAVIKSCLELYAKMRAAGFDKLKARRERVKQEREEYARRKCGAT